LLLNPKIKNKPFSLFFYLKQICIKTRQKSHIKVTFINKNDTINLYSLLLCVARELMVLAQSIYDKIIKIKGLM